LSQSGSGKKTPAASESFDTGTSHRQTARSFIQKAAFIMNDVGNNLRRGKWSLKRSPVIAAAGLVLTVAAVQAQQAGTPATIEDEWSKPMDGVLESLIKSKKYVVPLALLSPEVVAGMVMVYMIGGRFHVPASDPELTWPLPAGTNAIGPDSAGRVLSGVSE
jgi:hypothetical protein